MQLADYSLKEIIVAEEEALVMLRELINSQWSICNSDESATAARISQEISQHLRMTTPSNILALLHKSFRAPITRESARLGHRSVFDRVGFCDCLNLKSSCGLPMFATSE